MAKKNDTLMEIADYLVLVGAITWGTLLFGFNVVELLLGFIPFSIASTIVYGAVGIAGAFGLYKKIFG